MHPATWGTGPGRGGVMWGPHAMEMRAGASIHWLRLAVTW